MYKIAINPQYFKLISRCIISKNIKKIKISIRIIRIFNCIKKYYKARIKDYSI